MYRPKEVLGRDASFGSDGRSGRRPRTGPTPLLSPTSRRVVSSRPAGSAPRAVRARHVGRHRAQRADVRGCRVRGRRRVRSRLHRISAQPEGRRVRSAPRRPRLRGLHRGLPRPRRERRPFHPGQPRGSRSGGSRRARRGPAIPASSVSEHRWGPSLLSATRAWGPGGRRDRDQQPRRRPRAPPAARPGAQHVGAHRTRPEAARPVRHPRRPVRGPSRVTRRSTSPRTSPCRSRSSMAGATATSRSATRTSSTTGFVEPRLLVVLPGFGHAEAGFDDDFAEMLERLIPPARGRGRHRR